MGSGGNNIRVKKLARQLGKPVPQLLETLRQMGLERYAHPDAVIPGERLVAVRDAATAPDADPDFDAVMQSLGVRPLGKGPPSPSTRQQKVRAAPSPSRPPPPPDRPLRGDGEAPTVPLTAPPKSAHAPLGKTRDLTEALARVQGALAQVTRDLNREARAKKTLQAELAEVQTQLALTTAEHHEAQGRITRLEGALDAPAGGESALLSILSERGVQGLDESQRAIGALIKGRRFEALIAELSAPRPERLLALLDQHLVLHCGRPACPEPRGEPIALVSENRCEVCGGHGLTGPLQAFSDALLLRGWTRLGLQGGRPILLRHLEAHLDPRIRLRFLSEGRLPDSEPPHVHVRWLPGDLTPTYVEEVLLSTSPTLAGMLRQVTHQLGRI